MYVKNVTPLSLFPSPLYSASFLAVTLPACFQALLEGKLESWNVYFLFQTRRSLMSNKLPMWPIPKPGTTPIGLEL